MLLSYPSAVNLVCARYTRRAVQPRRVRKGGREKRGGERGGPYRAWARGPREPGRRCIVLGPAANATMRTRARYYYYYYHHCTHGAHHTAGEARGRGAGCGMYHRNTCISGRQISMHVSRVVAALPVTLLNSSSDGAVRSEEDCRKYEKIKHRIHRNERH